MTSLCHLTWFWLTDLTQFPVLLRCKMWRNTDRTGSTDPASTPVQFLLRILARSKFWYYTAAMWPTSAGDLTQLPVLQSRPVEVQEVHIGCRAALSWRKEHLYITNTTHTHIVTISPFSALTLLVGWQEGHPACKKTWCCFLGGNDLTGALHDQ